LENYQRHATWTPEIADSREGKCLFPALVHFPPPGQAIAEQEVRTDMLGIHWWIKIDSLSHYVQGHSVVVADLKTTGDLKYAKSPETLQEDAQRIAYAYWAVTTLDVEWCETKWVYARRKPPKSVTVSVIEHRDAITERFSRMVETDVRPMVAANATPLADLPRDGAENGECRAYGGCPHREECFAGVSPLVALRSALAGK
jgi:hypothetical protein